MRDLTISVKERLARALEDTGATGDPGPETLRRFVNEIDEDTDLEQVITFLSECGSAAHERLAETLRTLFQEVLASRLAAVGQKIGGGVANLYAVLVDMHIAMAATEEVVGFLTINYDDLLEQALRKLDYSVDRGIAVTAGVTPAPSMPTHRVLSLHGSFSWRHTWPICLREGDHEDALWIPPGIRKAKSHYPFNVIWGMARELLDCDVLRIVGCSLGKNDWDLVSMLFATRFAHRNSAEARYAVELIDRPAAAEKIRDRFPYLGALTLLDLDDIGERIYLEINGSGARRYDELDRSEQQDARRRADCDGNAFRYWLKQKGETADPAQLQSTPSGLFEEFLETYG